MSKFRLGLLVMGMLLVVPVKNFLFPSPQSLYPKVSKQTVLLKVETSEGTGYGSGVILGKEGLVLTVAHVLYEDRTSVTAVTYRGKEASCETVHSDIEHDLALLRCDRLRGMDGVASITAYPFPRGSAIVAAGHNTDPLTYTQGLITGYIMNDSKILMSALIGPGMSGGGVWTYDGRLVGLIQSFQVYPSFPAHIGSHLQVLKMLKEIK